MCNKCKISKDITEFNKDLNKKDELQTRCRTCKRESDNVWRANNRDYVNNKSKLWREQNPDRYKDSIKKWHLDNPDRIKEIRRESWKRASKEKKLRKMISVAVKRSLKGESISKDIFNKLGYSIEDLKEHISKQFKDGMSWDNHGEWHIDHITPQSLLPFSSMEDDNFIKCWSLSNLQPLWAKDNLIKSNKV